MELWSRRKFFLTSLAGSAVAGTGKLFGRATPAELSRTNESGAQASQGKRPLIISSANGVHALDRGMDILKKGGDTLEAVYRQHGLEPRPGTREELAAYIRKETDTWGKVIRAANIQAD